MYKNVCVEQYKTEYEPYTETECSTQYKDDCAWVPMGRPGKWQSLGSNSRRLQAEPIRDLRGRVQDQGETVCNDVPEQRCVDVPRQECVSVATQICTNQPLQKCQDVPRQSYQSVHKNVPVRVSRQVPKKVCQDDHSRSAGAVIKGVYVGFTFYYLANKYCIAFLFYQDKLVKVLQ